MGAADPRSVFSALCFLLSAHSGSSTTPQSLRTLLSHHGACEGFDEERALCEDLKPCETGCKPVDCEFSDWNDWYSGGGCTGLLFRYRLIHTSNNECGKPCDANKVESRRVDMPDCDFDAQDCVMSKWTEWGLCKSGLEQVYRKRQVIKSATHDGRACVGGLEMTKSCTQKRPIDCKFSSWHVWTDCSASCGEGHHSRQRRINTKADNGGAPCVGATTEWAKCEVKPCISKDCQVGDWDDWSSCSIKTQRTRERRIIQQKLGDGKSCDQSMTETTPCPVSNLTTCVLSDWLDWDRCDASCGGGQTQRYRFLHGPAALCNLSTISEVKPCNTEHCPLDGRNDCRLSDWTHWSSCSANCGQGFKERNRTVLTEAKLDGMGCYAHLSDVVPCKVKDCVSADCKWGDWYEWSGCSCTCGGGTRLRHRIISQPPHGKGKACPAETKSEAGPCNTMSCTPTCIDGAWGVWEHWSKCSATCGVGLQLRRRHLEHTHNECGKPAAGFAEEFKKCADLPSCMPDQDCEMSEWGKWSFCSCTCFGTKERHRFVKRFASGQGKPCEAALKMLAPCNPGFGEEINPNCGLVPPVDCQLTTWSDWGSCSAPCGGGQKERSRHYTNPLHGGQVCNSPLAVTAPCNTELCGPKSCQDCVWGAWGEWGACGHDGTQRYRRRGIIQMPNHCGKQCNWKVAKETSKCTSHKPEAVEYCMWTSWSAQGSCDPSSCKLTQIYRTRALTLVTTSAATPKHKHEFLFSGAHNSLCVGSQVNISKCHLPAKCPVPKCLDCLFSQWEDWSGFSGSGLAQRSRTVTQGNNHCGKPCEGALVETMRAPKIEKEPKTDCEFSDWSNWGACPNELYGQTYRSRNILKLPSSNGQRCTGGVKQTMACRPGLGSTPCQFSLWSTWNECTEQCGGGWQHRHRDVLQRAHRSIPCDGVLEEIQTCNTDFCKVQKSCTYDAWSIWSECSGDDQRFRFRNISQFATNIGKFCDKSLYETAPCGGKQKKDCEVSEWAQWDPCDKTCGGGQQHRHRQIHHFSAMGGKPCPPSTVETQGCNEHPCEGLDCELDDWADWGPCSTTCGTGLRERIREVASKSVEGGIGCSSSIKEAADCKDNPDCSVKDCKWKDWEPWGQCTCKCGGGQKTRTRHIGQRPVGGGASCDVIDKEEVAPCNTHSCHAPACIDGKWHDWLEWSPCSATCGTGTKFRVRHATEASACGRPAVGNDRESVFCNIDVPCHKSVDCTFSDWHSWGLCSRKCFGVKERSRRVTRFGEGAGKKCNGELKEIWPCHPGVNETAPEFCGVKEPIDCKLSVWAAWSDCTVTCGGGKHLRHRTIIDLPQYGGKPCNNILEEVAQCAHTECPSPAKADCAMGDWHQWFECDQWGSAQEDQKNSYTCREGRQKLQSCGTVGDSAMPTRL